MKQIRTFVFPSFILLASMQIAQAQAPVITAATPVATTIEQWGKFEVQLDIAATWSNPYNYDEIRVECAFIAPDGATQTVDGFFMQDFQPDTQNGELTPVGSGTFKVRFSPGKPGVWKYNLSCANASGTGIFPEQTFTATAVASPKNKGFVRGNQSNYLQFDDGAQFIPVGENICWQNTNAYLDYNNWLTKLRDNGGNFFRLWHCAWGLGIEWENGNNGFQGLRKYKQSTSFYQDWLYDFCAENGIYVMLCLHHHGQVSSQVNPNWSDSPYNAVNGGPCQNTWDFFTNTSAKNHVKNRLRYVLARWGHARSILAWELFNEVDWTDQFAQKKADVSAWHLEMAAFLKDKDPYQHLVTTSYAQESSDPLTWNQPDIDFTQTHHYVNTPNIERVLVSSNRKYLDDFGKPSLTGEFGLTTTGADLGTADPDGVHVHNSMWGTLFGGGMGAGMSWWWDNYIEPKDLYYHFGPLAAVAQNVPFQAGNLSPVPATVAGAPADLSLTPTLGGWGALADTSFTIENGQVSPPGAALASFLYGAQWNTQYRRPPVFYVNYPANGQFRVKTGSETGQAPKIAIWLDGIKVLEQNAAVNQTYSVNVPAGQHMIKVDNTGTDWISITNYTFSGIGSAVDAYLLKSDNQNIIAGWAMNNSYNHDYVKINGLPSPVAGATLSVPAMQNGSYFAKYYNCMTGALQSSEAVTVTNGALTLALPEILWDLSFVVDNQPVSVAETNRNMEFRLYPNPATPGPIVVSFDLEKTENVTVTLLDMAGRVLEYLFSGEFSGGEKQMQIAAHYPAGLYWVKIEADGKTGAKPVVLMKQ
ncbi:MAG: hypothetical protein EPGJADBJ_01808 [Saprospiraceae bacterium]|nr:hypothetical protein [Saprospiraceae bacterium]